MGYPSVDKPWLKYYAEELIKSKLPQCTMYEYLYENNKNNLDDVAINYFGRKYTYRWLFEKIEAVAKALVGNGVHSGDVVTVVALSSPVSVVLFYAINLAGAVSNFINVLLNEKDMQDTLIDSESRLVITLDLFLDKVLKSSESTQVEKIVSYSLADGMPVGLGTAFKFKTRKVGAESRKNPMTISIRSFLKSSGVLPENRKDPAQTAFYGHTGGTTGVPKTVLLSDNNFNAVAWQYVHTFPHEPGDVFLSVMVPFVTYGSIVNIHMPLCLGLELVLIPKFDAADWAKYIKKYHPVHLSAIPAYVSAMVDNDELQNMDLSGLKTVGMGGEGMNIPLENKINDFLASHGSSAKILKGYGMTECCATAAVEYTNARKEGSVGIPFINNNYMVFDSDTEEELPYEHSGEICMQCASLMLGYKNIAKDELVKTHKDGSQWIHSGDIGFIDRDGFIFIEGRMKRMIMTVNGGIVYKIFPVQTETVLNSCEKVRESCVVAWKVNNDIKLKAFLVLETSLPENEEKMLFNDLKQLCGKELSEHQVPVEFEVLSAFPRTAAGKIDYRSLENT